MVVYCRPGPPELFGAVWYRASTTNGRTWTTPTKASSPTHGRNIPADADIAGKTLVLYSASVEEWFDVLFRRATDDIVPGGRPDVRRSKVSSIEDA